MTYSGDQERQQDTRELEQNEGYEVLRYELHQHPLTHLLDVTRTDELHEVFISIRMKRFGKKICRVVN
jgi:hypothetical protein